MNENYNIPDYFKVYGINGDKLYSMYETLLNKGLSHPVAFHSSWLAIKEQPKKFYAFGKSYSDVENWANHVYQAVTGQRVNGIYKDAQNSTDYNSYAKAMSPYNKDKNYWTTWLPQGMKEAEEYIKSRTPNKPIIKSYDEIFNMPIPEVPDALRVLPLTDFKIRSNKNGSKLFPRKVLIKKCYIK